MVVLLVEVEVLLLAAGVLVDEDEDEDEAVGLVVGSSYLSLVGSGTYRGGLDEIDSLRRTMAAIGW
jgi:hypothetical protein